MATLVPVIGGDGAAEGVDRPSGTTTLSQVVNRNTPIILSSLNSAEDRVRWGATCRPQTGWHGTAGPVRLTAPIHCFRPPAGAGAARPAPAN
jgi:hypothetical protein